MRLTGGEIVVEYLIREGVPYVMGIPGHGCLALADAFLGREKKITVLQPRHEQSGVHMADGYYRATGNPLAVFTSIGPGAINTAIGIATAYVDSIPVLSINGDTHTYMRGKGVLQEIERQRASAFPKIMEPITKRVFEVSSVKELPGTMHRAFNHMMTGRRGPVVIDLPMDVQADSIDVTLPKPSTRRTNVTMEPDPDQIVKAARLLKKAKRPMIVAGGGARHAFVHKELLRVAEATGAGIVTTMAGKSAVPEDHNLYCWHSGSKGSTVGNYMTSHADVLLAVGCRFADETACSYRPGYSYNIPPTKLIHIDLDESQIGKNYPVEVGIVADAASALDALSAELGSGKTRGLSPLPRRAKYFNEIQRRNKSWSKQLDKMRLSNREPMTISRMIKEAQDVLPANAYITSSSGNTQAQIFQEYCFRKPGRFITTGGFSTMGFSIPAAMGVKLAKPDCVSVAIVGDGEFLMTIQELAMAVQLDMPVLFLVANNLGWIAIKDLQMAAYGKDRTIATDFLDKKGNPVSPNLAEAAKAFGCHAERVERIADLKPAIRRALKSGGPAVVECMTSREYPYTGNDAVGWWDVPIPTYLKSRRKKYEAERDEEVLL